VESQRPEGTGAEGGAAAAAAGKEHRLKHMGLVTALSIGIHNFPGR
jgi:zinc transporter ZupT